MKKNISTLIFVALLLCSDFVSAQTGTFEQVIIGSRTSTAGTVPRISIIPPLHLNTWIFNARDNTNDAFLDIMYSSIHQMTFKWNTGIGIGTDNPQYKLDVNGTMRAKEIIVETGWADFVFSGEYKLPGLNEVKSYITKKKHLSGIPTENEIKEKGVNVGDMQVKLLQKIEELTLYTIQQQETIDMLKAKVENLENRK
jgi:hypothetical protein